MDVYVSDVYVLGFEDVQQFDMPVPLFDPVRWWKVEATNLAFNPPAQPLASVEGTLIQQRLLVRVDGALRGTGEGAKGVQNNGP